MDNVRRYSSFIKRIVTAPEHIRVKLLKSSNDKIITAISEIILNIIHKNIKVSKPVLQELQKFKRVLYKLVNRRQKTSTKQRRHILVKNPKCLSPLIALF